MTNLFIEAVTLEICGKSKPKYRMEILNIWVFLNKEKSGSQMKEGK